MFTVEYSVRTAWTAVAQLLHLDKQPPPVYQGGHNPKVLLEALYTMHRHPAGHDATAQEGAAPDGAVPSQANPNLTSRRP